MKKQKKAIRSNDLVAASIHHPAVDAHPLVGAVVDMVACRHHHSYPPADAGIAMVAPRAHTATRALAAAKKKEDQVRAVMSRKHLGPRGPVLTVPVSRPTPTVLEAVGTSVATADANYLGLHKGVVIVPVVASPHLRRGGCLVIHGLRPRFRRTRVDAKPGFPVLNACIDLLGPSSSRRARSAFGGSGAWVKFGG